MKKNKYIRIITASALVTFGLTFAAGCGNSNTDGPVTPLEKALTIVGNTQLNLEDSVTYVAQFDGQDVTDVKWTSSNKKVAVIDSATGELTILSVGTTTISASKEGYKTAEILVTVIDPSLKSLTVIGETTVKTGETITLSAKDNATGATLEGVSWTTSDPNIATIAKTTGILTGRTEGDVTVTANKEGYNPATLKVTVTKGTSIEDGSHMIIFKNTVGIEYVCDKTTAKTGETVSFTVVAAKGVTVEKVLLNDVTEIAKTGDKYSFVMPDEDVSIKATIAVDSPVSIGGEQAIPLVLDKDGIYKSEELELQNSAQLSYFIKEDNGEVKALNFSHIDNYKCFGQVNIAKNYDKYGFELPGGFKYVFYYNPKAEKPCYIKRTGVTLLPNSASTFGKLFDEGKNIITTYPENVSAVHYTNSKTNEKYDFTRYANNETIAKVTNLLDQTKETALVYKKYDGNYLTVVDTYKEGENDPTRRSDTKVLSAKYNIVEDEASYTNYSYYEKTKREAEFDSNHYSHDMNSIEFDIMYAYRVGFGADEGMYKLEKATIDVVSTPETSGGFTTTITTTKQYEDDGQNYYRFFTYDVKVAFNANGSIKNGTYKEKSYGKQDYDFDNNKFLTGGQDRGTLEKELTFAYEYDDTLEAAPKFDTTPYFITELSNIRINNKTVNEDESKNILKKDDIISKENKTFDFEFAPTTALDAWQYDIIESTNEKVIGHSNLYRQFKATGFGEADVTIGNHTTNDVKATVHVSVPTNSVPIRNLYFDGTWGNVNETIEVVNAQKVRIYDGKVSRIALKASPSGANNTELNFEVDKPELLKVAYDAEKEIIALDATAANVTTATTVSIKVTSPYWESGTLNNFTTLTVVIEPGSKLTVQDMVGTWKALPNQSDVVSVDKDAITFTDTKAKEQNGIQYYEATATNGQITRSFLWGLDSANMPVVLGQFNETLHISYNTSTKELGFYFEYVEGDPFSQESEIVYFLGFQVGEEEYDIAYEMFKKAE